MPTTPPRTIASPPDLRLARDDPVSLRETHISWVFLAGDSAYKIKKPLHLPYLDYRTPARRLAMCQAEIDLNRRLAPGVYLTVRSLVPLDGGGLALSVADDPAATDYAVEMRRFDDGDTLAARLHSGTAGAAEIGRLGRRLAAFHAGAETFIESDGAERVKRSLDDNFATLRGQVAAEARPWLAAHERMAGALLAERWDELDARAAAGRIRDGHGDLRLEHVLLDGDIAIVDCIEFNPDLRRIDVGADLAFLVMELHRIDRRDLAAVLVAEYRAAGGDPGSDVLLALLAAYRAQVRAKVALTRAEQDRAGTDEAGALLRLSARLLWQSLTPLVIVVAGVSAAGKSTVAAALAEESGFPHLRTDVIRKSRAGLAPTAHAPSTLYDDTRNLETYAALGDEAKADADSGVIVDGTFRRKRDRRAFFAGLGPEAEVLVVECRVPADVLLARAASRERDTHRVSDADATIVAAQLGAFEPLDEIAAGDHVLLRTDRPADQVVSEITEAAARRASASRAR
jgi:aminoglycoside phosphotransferase family enzyme/predicted kinase